MPMARFTTSLYLRPVLLAVLLFAMIVSCNKQDELEQFDILLPQALKETFLFGEGSYWIMEETMQSAGFVDSVFVFEALHDTVTVLHPGTRQPYAFKERFRVKLMSSFYGREYHIATESSDYCYSAVLTEPCHFVVMEVYADGALQSKSRMYYYPDQPDNGWNVVHSLIEEPKVRITDVINQFVVQGETYENVRRVVIEEDRTFSGVQTIRYIAPGFGIIQWDIPHFGASWELKRHHLIRE
jgi:hypothetical protein